MIKLVVEDYCQECNDFEAECTKLSSDEESIFVVQCEHRDRCGSVIGRLLAKLNAMSKEENEDAKD